MRSHPKTNDYSEYELKHLLLEKLKLNHKQRLRANHQKAIPNKRTQSQRGYIKQDHQQRVQVFQQRYFKNPPVKRSRAQLVFEVILTLLELAAIVALVWLLIRGYQLLRAINADAQNTYAQLTPPIITSPLPANLLAFTATPSPIRQPTITEEPLPEKIKSVIMLITPQPQPTVLDFAAEVPMLPSGHLPPGKQTELPIIMASPFITEASDNIFPTSQDNSSMALWIKIPSIGVDHPIVQGDDDAALMLGVGQHPGSATPGSNGNLVLSAHNDIFGEIFRHLDKLVIGDGIIILTPSNQFTYIVEEIMILKPNAISVLEHSSESIVTLISCYPYWIDTHRIVVRASLLVN